MSKAENPFIKKLMSSNDDIKKNRAVIIAETAEAAQYDIVRELERELRDLRSEEMELTDLAPDSELSLLVVKKDFNADNTFRKLQSVRERIDITDVKLKIARNTYNEFFGELKDKVGE